MDRVNSQFFQKFVAHKLGPYVRPIARFEVDTLTLYHSSLEADAPIYTPIHQVKLQATAQQIKLPNCPPTLDNVINDAVQAI